MSKSEKFNPDGIALRYGHFIGGRFVRPPGDGSLEIIRPSDFHPLGTLPEASAATVDEAVAAAKAAFRSKQWGGLSPKERANLLKRFASVLASHGPELAELEAVTSTRLLAETRLREANIAVELLNYYAEYIDKIDGVVTPSESGSLSLILNEPYGVVAGIVPWNFPMTGAMAKIAPALAAGNTVVIKPSELTPFSALRVAELASEAGLPDGVLNVLIGTGAVTGTALVKHPDVRKISFTGSTATGARIMADAALSGNKPVTLELGGKSPVIVYSDIADLDTVAGLVTRGFLYNGGQVCTAGSRLIIDRKIKDALVERIADNIGKAVPGATWQAETTLAPIISQKQADRIDRLVRKTVEEGAILRAGGGRVEALNAGAFFQPTILDGLEKHMTGFREEFFGPVIAVQTFDDPEQALALADHPTYGLAASIFTNDMRRAMRTAKSVEAGTVWVNQHGRGLDLTSPGGGYKGSGFGKDWGRQGMDAYMHQKAVWINHG
jgi:aldehyde dehydrogenase (NAD+)